MLQIVTKSYKEKMKKRGKIRLCILGVILLFVSFSFYFVSVSGNNNWIIDEDRVYVNNDRFYISAQPHIIKESGYVYFNLTSKVYEGDVDILWGFDTDYLKPVKAELYKPEWKNITENYSCDFNNSYFNYTLNPKYAWCYENITIHNNQTNTTNGSYLRLIFEHNFGWGNLAEKTIYWDMSYLDEWRDISQTFDSINYEHGGMNKWYYVKNIPIEKNKNYLVRGFIEIPRGKGFSPINLDEKYWFAIKPSSETLQQAIANNHLYALDPWVNSTGSNQNKDYLTDGLEVYFSFEENASTGKVYDALGHVNITSLGSYNTQGVTGKIGKGFAVDGTGGTQGQLNVHQQITSSKNHTISFWVYLNTKDTSHRGFFQYWGVGGTDYNIDLHGFYCGDVGKVCYAHDNWYSSGQSIGVGGWHNVIITTNNRTLKVYLDSVWNGVNVSFNGDSGITNPPDGTNQYWIEGQLNGTFDELAVWNRTLNDTEIANLYNNGAGITYSPLLDTTPPETSTPIITPTQPKTTDNLQCNATLTDNMQTSLIANWTWYKDNVSYLSGIKTNVQNGTPTIITTLEAGNTSKGEEWKCEVTPFDGYNYGTPKNSSVTILNSPPIHTSPLLTTPSGKNFSYENITCYNQSTSDADNDIVTNIYNWYKNSQPFAVLNMPFEINVKDYSGYNNNGTIYGTTWEASKTTGRVGNASSFDGIDDYVYIKDSNSLDFTNKKSWEIWFKRVSFNTLQMLFDKTNGGTNYRLALRPDNKLEFSYFIPPVPTSFVWVTNTKNEFDLGIYNQTKWNDSAVTLDWTLEEKQIFYDDFESGNLTTKGWLTSGLGTPWFIETVDSYAGTYHAEAGGTIDESILSVGINTENYVNIIYSFYWDTDLLEPEEYLAADYYNGITWNNILTSNNPGGYFLFNTTLPNDANNNPNFAIRFRCLSNLGTEECKIDNVEIRGTSLIEKIYSDNGNYTSKIFDAEGISEWKNLSWTKSLPINTNLTFQIRSCNDFVCFGEIFVGPDNTTNTYFTNSEFNDISFITDNRYFQYKAYFSTTDIKKSTGLYSVSVNYIRNVTDGLINLVSNSAINDTNWHYTAITFDNSVLTSNFNLYLDSILETTKTEHNLPVAFNNNLYMGKRYPENDSFFNGIIDEVKIYNKALTQEQISNNYLLNYNKIVSQETNVSDIWMCQITPNDGEEDGMIKNSTSLSVLWAISFNVTSGEDGSQISNFNMNCNNSFSASGVNSPYETGFLPGSYECIFGREFFYDKTITFTADDDKIINVKMSREFSLTIEEHTWLEAIYNCIILQDCSLYNLLLEMNQTIGNIWENTKPTDESVITNETITNRVVNATSNLTINYIVNIPIKAGYNLGAYLPVRIGYWFLDENNKTCYNQGSKPIGVEDPYCQPLVIETIGPMGGSVSFVVKLRPELPAGNYNIKRIIDIDPNNIWINYGQETIGIITLTEALGNPGISLEKTGEVMPSATTPSSNTEGGGGSSITNINIYNVTNIVKEDKTEELEKEVGEGIGVDEGKPAGITGALIGTGLLSGGQITFIIVVLCGTFVIFIIVRYKTIRIKKKQ